MIVKRLSEQKPQEALMRIRNDSRKKTKTKKKQKTVKEQPKANKMAPTKEKG